MSDLQQELPVYEELIDFLVEESPERFADFHTSDKVRERVWELVRREKNQELTLKEKAELDTYANLEHIMRLAKAKARLNLLKNKPQTNDKGLY